MLRVVLAFITGYLLASSRMRRRIAHRPARGIGGPMPIANTIAAAAPWAAVSKEGLLTADLVSARLGQAFDETYIWVASSEDHGSMFSVRKYGPTSQSVRCWGDDVYQEPRGNWDIISGSDWPLTQCSDMSQPPVPGTLYQLRRTTG